jgi:hypothetical protein
MPRTELSQMNPEAVKLFVFYYELADFKAVASRIEWHQTTRTDCPRDWIQKNDSSINTLATKLYVKKFLEELTNLLSVNFPYGSIGSTRFDNWLRKFFTEQKEQYDEGLITMDELMFLIFEKMKEESRINMK